MSNQSGIHCTPELIGFFGHSREKYRLLKIVIKDEQLILSNQREGSPDLDPTQEWNRLIPDSVDDSDPCFLFYRMSTSGDDDEWVLITWSPDNAPVRSKMLYASTKATLKKEFGSGLTKEIYANTRSDLSYSSFLHSTDESHKNQVLSQEEIEREESKIAHAADAVAIDSKQQTVGGLMFPLSQQALDALRKMAQDKSIQYLQLSIDVDNEAINLEEKAGFTCEIQELPGKVPSDVPRYHLFKFNHTHEGDYLSSVVFIYSMPGYKCSIKERMLYSACNNNLAELIESYGISIAKKVQIDEGSELTEEFLQNELHPPKNLNRPKFARPAPPNRGNRRLTKNTTSTSS